MTRCPDQDYAKFRSTCEEIRRLVDKMRQQEDQPNPELKSQVALLFTDLKQLNRMDKYRMKRGRDAVMAIKGKVDSFYLKLQNLMYEVIFVQKEIKRSLDYKSKADDVDLGDLHSFLKEVSDDVCTSVRSLLLASHDALTPASHDALTPASHDHACLADWTG